jgi:hypothetical protein
MPIKMIIIGINAAQTPAKSAPWYNNIPTPDNKVETENIILEYFSPMDSVMTKKFSPI